MFTYTEHDTESLYIARNTANACKYVFKDYTNPNVSKYIFKKVDVQKQTMCYADLDAIINIVAVHTF